MRMWRVTSAAAWSLVDQVLSSGTNVAASVLVARVVGPAEYGSFTLVFGTWTILLGATRAILCQPYTVLVSGSAAPEWRGTTRAAAATVLLFGAVFSLAAFLVGMGLGLHTSVGSAFVMLGIFAAPLALQDFWRFAGFSQNSPRAATYNDGVWALVQTVALAALVGLGVLTPATAVAGWGLGALAGALYGLQQFHVWPALGASDRTLIRKNAGLAGWYGVATASYQAGSYGAVLLVGAGIGTAALGGLASVGNLLAPARLMVSSGEAILLPNVSGVARHGDRCHVRDLCTSYSLLFAALYAVAGGGLMLTGRWALRFIFGPDYDQFSPILLPVVLAGVVSGLASGVVLGFRALGEARALAAMQVASAAGRIAIVAATLPFGVVAVAWGLALAEASRTALAWVMLETAVQRVPAEGGVTLNVMSPPPTRATAGAKTKSDEASTS